MRDPVLFRSVITRHHARLFQNFSFNCCWGMYFAFTSHLFYSAVIGLRGIQLFVDAGIPVDTELVRNLIMDVLQEKVASMLGYPKPQAETPATTQQQVLTWFILSLIHSIHSLFHSFTLSLVHLFFHSSGIIRRSLKLIHCFLPARR